MFVKLCFKIFDRFFLPCLRTRVLILGFIALIVEISVALFQMTNASATGFALWNLLNLLATMCLIYGSQKAVKELIVVPLIVLTLSAGAFFALLPITAGHALWYREFFTVFFSGFFLIVGTPFTVVSLIIIWRRYKEVRDI